MMISSKITYLTINTFLNKNILGLMIYAQFSSLGATVMADVI